LRNQHRKVYVLYSCIFKSLVQICLDIFPDCISIRQIVQASFHAGIVAKLCLSHHIRVPLSEIFISGCDRLYKFFVVLCHVAFSSQSIFFTASKDFCPLFLERSFLLNKEKHRASVPNRDRMSGGTTLINNKIGGSLH